MPRPALVIGDDLRRRVRNLAGLGWSERAIARGLGISRMTMRKHFRDDVQQSSLHLRAATICMLFESAEAGRVGAMIRLLRMMDRADRVRQARAMRGLRPS